jgi:hypothetical protein
MFRAQSGLRTTGVTVAKGYWINQSDVTDEAGHAVYAKAVASIWPAGAQQRWYSLRLAGERSLRDRPAAGSLFRNFPTMRAHWRLIIPMNIRKSRSFGATPQ